MISTRESAKRDCIYRDRTCRWLYLLFILIHFPLIRIFHFPFLECQYIFRGNVRKLCEINIYDSEIYQYRDGTISYISQKNENSYITVLVINTSIHCCLSQCLFLDTYTCIKHILRIVILSQYRSVMSRFCVHSSVCCWYRNAKDDFFVVYFGGALATMLSFKNYATQMLPYFHFKNSLSLLAKTCILTYKVNF